MDTAAYARQSDPIRNRHFRRRWRDDFQTRDAPADDADIAETALAVVVRWRDEWRQRWRQAAEAPR